ncbi:MAG TPA: pirin family protein [Ilumatobacteraceae bacterium]
MGSIELVIAPRRRSIGRDEVDRLLPYRERRMVGPFVYADLIGPDRLAPGVGIDVPVHPHIGLATVTYLFDGALVHRDSTGAVQRIEPGGVNWMTAGAGVAHSERSPDDERAADSTIAGLQTWVALPAEAEEAPPSFQHVPVADVPSFELGDAHVRLLAGHLAGKHSPTQVASPLYHCDVQFDAAGVATVDEEHRERGVLVIDGDVSVAGRKIAPRHLAVLAPGGAAEIRTAGAARVVSFGGARVGDRTIVWNFVGSTRERIDRAAAAWRAGDWPPVPGDDEIVPMP